MKQDINQDELTEEVNALINKKREGDYWDFKEKHHDNKADLLHDILCMSNSLYSSNKYIIFGVNNTCEIVGVIESDDRKSQAKIIDFLKAKSFAGDIRPEIELHTIAIDHKKIDVLIIFDSKLKPYFITTDYSDMGKVVRANFIYTRVGDTNIAKDRSADLYHIEKMWQQRFGLDMSIANRFRELLKKPQEWIHNPANKYLPQEENIVSHFNFPVYHTYFSEFQIELSESEQKDGESFCHFYPNKQSYWGTAYFKYHTTIIFKIEYVYCDGMRILLPVPEIENLFTKEAGCWFYYYILDNDIGLFFQFLRNKKLDTNSGRGAAPILIFHDRKQKEFFTEHARRNKDAIENIQTNFYSSRLSKTDNYYINALFLSRIHQFYINSKESKTIS